MFPLILANLQEEVVIVKISGNTQSKNHLSKLGLTKDTAIKVISNTNGNLIIQCLESRIALGVEHAKNIYVKKGV